MTRIVNLRTRRRQRARDEKRRDASVTAAAAGETRTGRAARAAETSRADRHLDGHRREPPEE